MNASITIDSSHYFNFNELLDHQFMIVNDGVMGGKSTSQALIKSNHLNFSGEVSLANNGGFASVRMLWPFSDSVNASSIKLRVKGDGKRYQFRLRTDQGFDGAAYIHEFSSTEGQWQSLTIAIADFVPQFRGRTLTNMPILKTSDVKQMGFLIASKQQGTFEIVLDGIGLE